MSGPIALDTITVTAQKRPPPAQDVPISMSVLYQDDLENARGATLEDIQQLVPNFSLENQGGFNVLTIRGVGGGGRNIGFDPQVDSRSVAGAVNITTRALTGLAGTALR